jgi:hypothetical protein
MCAPEETSEECVFRKIALQELGWTMFQIRLSASQMAECFPPTADATAAACSSFLPHALSISTQLISEEKCKVVYLPRLLPTWRFHLCLLIF